MEYRNILLILLLFFLLIQYKNKSVIEGIDGENTPSPETLTGEELVGEGLVGEDLVGEDLVGEECKAIDVLENKNGYCNVEEGDVIGTKTNGDISECRCECKNGYLRNHELNTSNLEGGSVNSCIETENIEPYQCFQECNTRFRLLREGEYSNKEICDEIKKMEIDCGRTCTLEGGGSIKSHNMLHKDKFKMLLNSDHLNCELSSTESLDLIINSFVDDQLKLNKIIELAIIFEVDEFNFETVISLTDDKLSFMLLSRSTENIETLKLKIIDKYENTCSNSFIECYQEKSKFFKNKIDEKKEKNGNEESIKQLEDTYNFMMYFWIILQHSSENEKENIKNRFNFNLTDETLYHTINLFKDLSKKAYEYDIKFNNYKNELLNEYEKTNGIFNLNGKTIRNIDDLMERGDSIEPGIYEPGLFMNHDKLSSLLCNVTLPKEGMDILNKTIFKIFFPKIKEFTDLEYLCNSRTCLNNHDSTNNKICTAFRYSDEKRSGNGGNCCEELSTFDTIYYNILDFFT